MSEWIKCSERMPNYDTPVVGLCEFGVFIFEWSMPSDDFKDLIPDPYWALLNFDGSDGIETFSEINPTHWMPLPPPPEET